MNCEDVRKLLSAYHDGELESKLHAAVAEHLHGCGECAATLTSFEQISDLSRQLTHPTPPDQWVAIKVVLAAAATPRQVAKKSPRTSFASDHSDARPKRSVSRSSLALAFTVLIAFTGLGAYLSWPLSTSRDDAHLAANLDAYLNQFERNPLAAERVLLTSYHGEQVDLPAATKLLGYQPAVAGRLPPGYFLDAVYVLDMPCCKCPQVICRRQGKGWLAVFEHEVDQPIWFGERPVLKVQCSGKSTQIVEISTNFLAATWQSDKRYMTVVGARDVREVTKLVSYLEGRGEAL